MGESVGICTGNEHRVEIEISLPEGVSYFLVILHRDFGR